MKVRHGRFQVFVPKHSLHITDKGTFMQGMGGVGVPKHVRGQTLQVALVRNRLDRSLDVGLMATPTNLLPGVRMATGAAGREQPSPAFRKPGLGILFAQQSRERDGDALGSVFGGEDLGQGQLPPQRIAQAWE